jgi:hypothetical protein
MVSQVLDQEMQDSPSADNPPAKLTRTGPSEEERRAMGEVMVAVDSERRPVFQSLQQEAVTDLQLPQYLRSKAILYTRRSASTLVSATRKSSRNQGRTRARRLW